jgi:dTDP-4-amino-4,6-dideoxygalactose transaminase
MLNTEFSPWPSYSKEEAEAVSNVLLSNRVNYWTGNECREFEKEFAVFADSQYAIALANGTLALELALRSLHLKEKDEVIVTPRSFVASVSSVVTVGAKPIFADVDRNTQALSVETIKAATTENTKAIVLVHLGGMPADLDEILQFAADSGIYVVEDCAQAHGAKYKGKSVGSFGHVSAWSFCQDKIMTTGGEGGMVTTNDRDLWTDMWSYKDHGKSWSAVYETQHAPGFRWLHESIGSNYRMNEMQAVLGRIQLQRMPQWNKARLRNANAIWDECRKVDWLRVPYIPEDVTHAAYKAYVFIDEEKLPASWSREKILDLFSDARVPVATGSCSEIYLEKAFSDNYPTTKCPVSEELGRTSLMFLVHPTLSDQEITKTTAAIRSIDGIVNQH